MSKQLTILNIAPDGTHTVDVLTSAPSLKYLQKLVGGLIEPINYFTQFKNNDEWVECIAFCNEEGKLQGLKSNSVANRLWQNSLVKVTNGKADRPWDVLVGNVIVIFGDSSLMKEI